MSYTIKKSDGTTLASVPENDIVLDAASVALIGRGATNYGAAHSEAFVHIIENFANTAPPAHPLEGQLWFDKTVSAMKVYTAGSWNLIGGGSGGGGGSGSGTNVGGPVYVMIDANRGILVFIASGKIVACVSALNIPNTDLPVSITVLNQTIALRSRFPFGVEAGHNLANDPEDYIYYGHVPNADASIWAGGGSPFAATTFLDLGANSIALSISNGVLIAAYSAVAVPNANLPSNFTVNGITMPFRASFPSGLRKGLTMSDGMGIGTTSVSITDAGGGTGGSVTTEIQALFDQEVTARSSAITTLYAYANSTFATAGLVNQITASFLSGTGQSSLASAIDYLIATAGSGTSNAQYAVDLKAEVTSAITGATSFANALQILNTHAQESFASSTDLTNLESRVKEADMLSLSKALQKLYTQAIGDAKPSVATATSANITLTGEQTINGVLTAASRILVKDQTNAAQNGIYVTATGAWTRATDMNDWAEVPNTFVLVGGAGSLSGTGWICTSAAQGTIGTTAMVWAKADLTNALSGFKTQLNTEFEAATGYATFADAVQDLQTSSGSSGSTAAFDTDLRTRFTNAMAVGETQGAISTISQAMDKLKLFSGKIVTAQSTADDIIAALKQLTGTGAQQSTATAVQQLVSNSGLTAALATFRTTLTSQFVSDINSNTGGSSTTFSGAIADVVAATTSNGSGSTSSIDTTLRNLFITGTHEADFPVTTISQAITKLMTNTTSDRASAAYIQELQTVLKTGLNASSMSGAQTNLTNLSTQSSANAAFISDLSTRFVTESGQSSISNALDFIATTSRDAGANATKVTQLTSAITNATGNTDVATAVQKLWTQAGNMLADTTFDTTFWNLAPTYCTRGTRNGSGGFAAGNTAYYIDFVVPPLNTTLAETNNFPRRTTVAPNTRYYFNVDVSSNVAPTNTSISIGFFSHDSNGTQIGSTPTGSLTFTRGDQITNGAAPKTMTVTGVTPANAATIRVFVLVAGISGNTGTIRFENPKFSASANQTVAGYSLDVQAGGRVAGLQLIADSAQKISVIALRADQFKFWSPSTPDIIPFRIQDNVVYIDNAVIQNASIGADKLTQLAVTAEVYRTGYQVGNGYAAIFAGAMMISTGNVIGGSKVVIHYSSNVTGSDSGGMYATILRSDGKYLQGTAEFGNPDEGGSAQAWTWSDTVPSTGTWTYTVMGSRINSGSCYIRNAHMIGLVQKQYGTTSSAAAPAPTTDTGGGVYYDPTTGTVIDYGGGGYNTGGCVATDSYMHNGIFARDVTFGSELLVLDYSDMDSTYLSTAKEVSIMPQPSVRLESETGIWLVCSLSTPLTLYDGSIVFGHDVLGKKLAVQDSNGFRWETISKVDDAGIRDVVLIRADNQTYAAGGEKDRLIFTHNPVANK